MASDPKELATRLREEKEFAIKDVDGDWLRLGKCHHPEAADMLEALAAERDAAWKAGAEAMREKCVRACLKREKLWRMHYGHDAERLEDEYCAAAIRALPTPSREGGDV